MRRISFGQFNNVIDIPVQAVKNDTEGKIIGYFQPSAYGAIPLSAKYLL